MKNARKLLPAIAMLLISAVMMSTASFAWFSVNTTATASGMSVTVASATNILISDNANNGFASSKTFAASTTALEPASAKAATVPEFYYMQTPGSGMNAANSSFGADPEFAAGAENTHYITFTNYLKVVGGEAANDLTIIPTITFSDTDSPVYPALRVLFVVDDTTPYLYAPLGNAASADTVPIEGLEGTTPKVASTPDPILTHGTSPIVSNTVNEQVYKVTVYVWLEGQDAACTAANAISLQNNGITIGFNIPAV